MRSSMPPCPGRIAPESFTPAPRLISDSTRSPKLRRHIQHDRQKNDGPHRRDVPARYIPSGRVISPTRSSAELICSA